MINCSYEHATFGNCLTFSDAVITLAIIVLVGLAVLGNLGVILSVFIYRRMRTFTNMLLVSLASADLLVGGLVMPPAMVYLLDKFWRYGDLACELWATLDVLLCTASILNLCVISLDRYVAILFPLRYMKRRTKRLAISLVLGVWVLSVIICAPPWFVSHWGFMKTETTRQCGYVNSLSYRLYSACGSFFFPLFIMLFVYYRILRVASTREQMLCHVPMQDETTSSSGRRSVGLRINSSRKTKSSPTLDSASTWSTPNYRSFGVGMVPVKNLSRRLDLNPRAHRGGCNSTRSSYRRSNLDYEGELTTVGAAEMTIMDDGISHGGFLTIDDRNSGNSILEDFPTLTESMRKEKGRSGGPNTLMSNALRYYSHSRPVKAKKEKNLYLRERKALKTIGIIVVGFIVCWFPFFLCYVLQSACRKCKIPDTLELVFLWLGYSNSVLNPLIYTCYNQDFRKCFRDMLRCGCCRSREGRRMSVRILQSKSPIV